MKNIKIIADSTCDLNDELLEKYDISIIPLYIQLDDKSYLDRLEITPDDIYKWSDQHGKTQKQRHHAFEQCALLVFHRTSPLYAFRDPQEAK